MPTVKRSSVFHAPDGCAEVTYCVDDMPLGILSLAPSDDRLDPPDPRDIFWEHQSDMDNPDDFRAMAAVMLLAADDAEAWLAGGDAPTADEGQGGE